MRIIIDEYGTHITDDRDAIEAAEGIDLEAVDVSEYRATMDELVKLYSKFCSVGPDQKAEWAAKYRKLKEVFLENRNKPQPPNREVLKGLEELRKQRFKTPLYGRRRLF